MQNVKSIMQSRDDQLCSNRHALYHHIHMYVFLVLNTTKQRDVCTKFKCVVVLLNITMCLSLNIKLKN